MAAPRVPSDHHEVDSDSKREAQRAGATSEERLSVSDLVQDGFAVDSTIRHQRHLAAVQRPEQSILPAKVHVAGTRLPREIACHVNLGPAALETNLNAPAGSSPPVTLALVRPEALRATPFSTTTA